MAKTYLAIDVGGGSGRGIVGTLDGCKMTLKEVCRFENNYVPMAGKYYWNTLQLFHEMIKCVKKAQEEYADLSSFCADLWGGDFAFLDKNGQPIGYSWCTRNADGKAVEAFFENVMSDKAYVMQCGSQIRRGNAPFQLYERILEKDPAIANADRFLMLPDYFGYLFTGKKYNEFTVATTSQMISPRTGTWNKTMIEALGLPETMFGELVMPGTVRYDVLSEVLPAAGKRLKYVPVASHDTASAVTSITVAPDEVFSSSGTWSIIGVECDTPTVNEDVYRYSFSNEGTIDGRWRLQKDVMGMWCMQNLYRIFSKENPTLTWEDIVDRAKAAAPFRSLVNLAEPIFTSDKSPVETIRAYCEKTGQPVPETLGELSRCIYESMALQYKQTIDQVKELSGRKLNKLRIVGGGGKNQFLDQMIADATGMVVEVGPYESACIGNILMQAVAEGVISKADFPKIIRESFEVKTFRPKKDMDKTWKQAEARFAEYCGSMYL